MFPIFNTSKRQLEVMEMKRQAKFPKNQRLIYTISISTELRDLLDEHKEEEADEDVLRKLIGMPAREKEEGK